MANRKHFVGFAGGVLGILLASNAAWAYYGTVTVSPTDVAPNASRPLDYPYLDAPISMLKSSDPNKPFWFTTGFPDSWKFQGPLNNPFETLMSSWPNTSSWWIHDMTGPWKPWMCNIYKHTDGTLIGFVHLEDQQTPPGQEYFKIGIAYSNNGGARFSYLGDIIEEDYPNDFAHNIKGAPYIIRYEDGFAYFYLYFNDLVGPLPPPNVPCPSSICITSVARAKVSDVMAAAAIGQLAPWKKYYNGQWNQDGIRGMSTGLDTPYWVNTHSDIAYSTTLGKYVWASATGAPTPPYPGNGVALLFSSDGLSWTGKLNVYQTLPGAVAGSYASIGALPLAGVVDDTAYQVGSAFDVYYRKGSGTYTLGRASVSLSTIQPLWTEDFNTMTDGAAPTGWSVYGVPGAGDVHIDSMTGTFDRNLHLYDTSPMGGVSAVKGFPPHAIPLTVELEFHLNDNGSRQNFRIKGNSSSVDAVWIYAYSGKLYWMNPATQGGTPFADVIANRQYSLKIRARATPDLCDIYFDGANTPTVSNAAFWLPVQNIDSVAVGTDGPGIGDSYVDDVWVYTSP